MSVALVDGVWRVVDPDRATTIHGREPQRDADRTVESLLDGPATDLIVVIGLGLGFLLDALERRAWNGRVLAIEPEPETVPAMRARRDWSAWTKNDRLRMLIGPGFEGATDSWQWLGDGAAEPRLFVHPVFERIRPSEVAAARAVLKRMRFDAASNAEARRRQGARYLLNTLRNLPAIASQADASQLSGAAHAMPAVIVAAGPSLDAAIPSLREVQHHALIVAVDTAARPLLAAGVRPHAVVAVDPSEANGRHLLELPPSGDTYFVSEGSIDPLAVAAFRGRTYFFSVSDHQPWPWLGEMNAAVGRLRAMGSVLTSAFDLVLRMGANPVVFVGADLSYPRQRTYARGVSFEDDWRWRERFGVPLEQQWREAIEQWPRTEEEDVSGVPVRTAPHLVTFRNWLVEQMRQDTSRRFINAGGAGILKGPNIEQLPPAALVDLLRGEGRPAIGHPFRDRYQPQDDARLRAEVARLAERAAAGDRAIPVFGQWQDFAPLLSLEAIALALDSAKTGFEAAPRAVDVPAPPAAPAAGVETDVQALQEVAAAVPLVPLTMPPQRLDAASSGARVFRFRTTAASIMSCAMRPIQHAVAEDGVAMTRVYGLDLIEPGTYAVHRDQVHFRAFDGSDPRTNGRTYTILVSPPVAYLESLSLQEILDRQV